VRLQDAGAEVLVLIADYQVLTDRDTADRLDEQVMGLVLDYLAIGIDPARSTIFAHSAVPGLNQLILPFLSLVTVPELHSLVLLAALCTDADPVSVAEEIGDGGAAALKRTVTEAVNERFAPIRARRRELAADAGHARQVLRDGGARASAIADATLTEVRAAMAMYY
jgi:tryptophanyl-tRNA synthetase